MAEEKKEEAKQDDAAVKADGPAAAPEAFRTVLGEKIGMTQIFTEKGELKAVTVVKAGPCTITAVKTKDSKDGYNCVQLGYGTRKEKHVNKAIKTQSEKRGHGLMKVLKEFRVSDTAGFEAGQIISIEGRFTEGDYVDVQGTSKGKGFSGVMKRHNFGGLRASHGSTHKARSPGSISSRRSLGRVLPGQRMAGHGGQETVTVQKIEVIQVEADKGLLYLDGSVPGARGTLVVVSETVKGLKRRKEEVKAKGPRKDKMGNIIQDGGAKKGKK